MLSSLLLVVLSLRRFLPPPPSQSISAHNKSLPPSAPPRPPLFVSLPLSLPPPLPPSHKPTRIRCRLGCSICSRVLYGHVTRVRYPDKAAVLTGGAGKSSERCGRSSPDSKVAGSPVRRARLTAALHFLDIPRPLHCLFLELSLPFLDIPRRVFAHAPPTLPLLSPPCPISHVPLPLSLPPLLRFPNMTVLVSGGVTVSNHIAPNYAGALPFPGEDPVSCCTCCSCC